MLGSVMIYQASKPEANNISIAVVLPSKMSNMVTVKQNEKKIFSKERKMVLF